MFPTFIRLHVKLSPPPRRYLRSDLAARDAPIRLYRLYRVSSAVKHHLAPPLMKLADSETGHGTRDVDASGTPRPPAKRRSARLWRACLRSKLLIGLSGLGGGPGPPGWSSVEEANGLS